MEERVRRLLEDKASEFRMSPQAPNGVLRRARVRMVLTGTLMGALLVSIGAGVFYGAAALIDGTPDTPPVKDITTIPDEARVRCTEEGVDAFTSEVRPQGDGIHILFDNQTDRRTFYLRDADSTAPNHGGRLSPHAATEIRATFAPGEILVGCFPTQNDSPFSEVEGQGFGRLSIVDPEGLWVSPEPDCTDPSKRPRVTASEVSGPDEPDFESMARQYVPGVEPNDVFEHPGYPETEFHADEMLLVLRDGESIASLSFFQEQGSWKIGVRACPDSGIGGDEGSSDKEEEPTASDYPLVAERGSLKVYAPGPGQPWGWCPEEPLSLDQADLRQAEQAVLLTVHESSNKSEGFDPRGATARAALGSEVGVFTYARKRCGDVVVERTSVVDVSFPKMSWSASLSSATFYVSREERGWVVWDWPS